MYSWERLVEEWSECWDLEKNKIKNMQKYREFRNTKQGLPFEEKGESVSYDKAIIHRRLYARGEINNTQIKKDTGSLLLLVLCTVDCQKNNLFVDIKGYTAGGRTYTIDFFSLEGQTENINSESWKALEKLIDEKIYIDEVGRQYKIINTFVDSGHFTEYVYSFCSKYSTGVYPIKGERSLTGNITFKQMSKQVIEKSGCSNAFLINTTRVKDHIAKNLQRSEWYTDKVQPEWYPNFPQDLGDDYFKQFEAESKVEKRDSITNQWLASFWKQISGRDNHAFDTYGYHMANLEFVAETVCKDEDILNLLALDWTQFWEYAETGVFYIDKD